MADQLLESSATSDSVAPSARLPWWLKVLGIFLVSRVVTTALLLGFASVQNTNPWTGPKPDYFHFAGIWDGFWYFIIAVGGYPNQLPTTSDGYVGENAWAFMPAYPMVVRIVMHVTTLDYSVASVIVSVGFALGTALLFYKLMSLVLPSNTALFAVVLFCFAPLSPIMQVAYAESMHTFLLTLALYLLLKGRYWLMVPVVAVMSLTRPSGMAFALLMLLHVVYRWWRSRPSAANREEFPFDERVASVALAFFSAFMGIAWVLIAWAVTGSVTAYTDTEMAWRSAYVGRAAFLPFTPWFQAVDRFWAPWWGIPNWLLIGMLVLAIAAFFGLLFTPWVRRLGVDLRLWVASYGVYLLAVFFPQSSTFRLLVPMFPLLGAFAIPRSRVYRVAIVLLFVLGQWAWIYMAWWVDGYDWTPP